MAEASASAELFLRRLGAGISAMRPAVLPVAKEHDGRMRKPKVLVFDLVETLLDLSALDKYFRSEFGSARVRREWFREALKIAFSATAAGSYYPFADMTKAALKVMEARYDTRLSWIARRRILSTVRELPAFPDVQLGISRLAESGIRMAVLTNSARSLALTTLKNADVLQYFDQVLSSDAVNRLKPAPEPYRYAAKKLRVKPKDLLMIAAHDWDLTGAHAAGFQTCFVARPEHFLNELAPEPEMVVRDIEELARQLTRS